MARHRPRHHGCDGRAAVIALVVGGFSGTSSCSVHPASATHSCNPASISANSRAIARGIATTEAGYRTYFTSVSHMVGSLQSADLEGESRFRMRTFTGPSVLVIDELGYLLSTQASANWIFEVDSRRYEKGSVVLTPNRGFSDWAQVSPTAWSPPPSLTACRTAPRGQHPQSQLSNARSSRAA